MLMNHYKLNLVALVKPRINGERANDFIRKCGFMRTHKVELIGFAGVIWLLWNKDIQWI